jgi:hypothetical protein
MEINYFRPGKKELRLFPVFLAVVLISSSSSGRIISKWRKLAPVFEVRAAETFAMTFISVPKPEDHLYGCVRLKLAFASWLGSDASSRVILLMNRSDFCSSLGFAEELDMAFGAGRIRYGGPCLSDAQGVPYVNMWFKNGMELCQTGLISFINSDIVLSATWLSTVSCLLRLNGSAWKPIIMSSRLDVAFDDHEFDRIRFTAEFLMKDIEKAMNGFEKRKYDKGGVDVISFYASRPPFNVSEIPPFLMGRFWWDSWFIYWAVKNANPILIDFDPPVYHLNHSPNLHRGPQWKRNLRLMNRYGMWHCPWHIRWVYNNGELKYREGLQTILKFRA